MRKIFSRMEAPSVGGGGGGKGLPLGEPESFTLGSRLLHVEEVIAEGGFGVVFLVRAPSGGSSGAPRRMALKRMFVNNERDLSICRREINIVSSLSGHPHLIGYLDSSVTPLRDGVTEVLLLMPYHRTTLLGLMNELLCHNNNNNNNSSSLNSNNSGSSPSSSSSSCSSSSTFPEKEVLKIFTEICSAVARLHHCSTPIIHRDLKVENILRSDDHRYILCDFGSATIRVLNPAVQGVTTVQEEIQRYTTLSYRSPEMVDLYSNKPLNTKIDIWALGCLLYHICFLSLPFGDSALAIQSGTLVFPKKHSYSDNLLKLIRYLLTPDMDSRPDIFQASYLACLIAQKECNVQNLHNVSLPNLDSLPVNLPLESSRSPEAPRVSSKAGEEKQGAQPTDKMTSIAPRQRPKASKAAAILSSAPQILPPAVVIPSLQKNSGESSSKPSALSLSSSSDHQQQHHHQPATVPDPSTSTSWNPFSDSTRLNNPIGGGSGKASLERQGSFGGGGGEEDFGEMFDRLRQEQKGGNSGIGGGGESMTTPKDPFGYAPFFK